jgi:hypothetical protein
MTEIVVVTSDHHITSTLGLCPPNYTLDDRGEYRPSPGQRFLMRSWGSFWNDVKELAEQHHAPVTAIFNGDTVEADAKKRSNQIITRNKAKIVEAAYQALEPAIKISDRTIFIRGTGAHEGESSELAELLAADLTITEKAPNGNHSWWQFLGEFGGVLFDIEHHGPLGRTPWTITNPMNGLAVRLMLKYAGRRLPAVAIRSHNHRKGDTYDNHPIRVLATGAWQLETEYVRRIGGVEGADIQGLIFICDGGEYQCLKRLYTPLPTKIWTSQTRTC